MIMKILLKMILVTVIIIIIMIIIILMIIIIIIMIIIIIIIIMIVIVIILLCPPVGARGPAPGVVQAGGRRRGELQGLLLFTVIACTSEPQTQTCFLEQPGSERLAIPGSKFVCGQMGSTLLLNKLLTFEFCFIEQSRCPSHRIGICGRRRGCEVPFRGGRDAELCEIHQHATSGALNM